MVGGIALLTYGAIVEARTYYPGGHPTSAIGFEAGGAVLLGVSLGALVTGIVFLAMRSGIESTRPLTPSPTPQVTIGPLSDGASGTLTWRF
jgi:hypothetical protein